MNETNAGIAHLWIMHTLGVVDMLLCCLTLGLCFDPLMFRQCCHLAGMLHAAPQYRQMLHGSFVYSNICTWPTNHMPHARLLTACELQIFNYAAVGPLALYSSLDPAVLIQQP
ncbi:TPA: hypothetical protein ACH3X2_013293 [Trebouxia sp. C0005]